MSKFFERLRKPLAAVGFGVRSSATQADASVPMVESGAGVPSHATTGTAGMYIRTDPAGATTVLYVTHDSGSTWTALT